MNILHSIGAGIASIGLFIASIFGYTPDVQAPIEVPSENLGVALPSATAVFETSLASGITADATTLTLTSVSIRGGGTLSGYVCLSLDEGSAQAEFVCGTASSTSVTGLERGLSPADGITEDTDLQFSHRRGASVKITDFPLIQRIKSQNAGSGTFESVLSYASGVTPTGGSELADVEYVTSAITGTSTLSYNRIIVNGTAGETLTTGTIVYLKSSDSRWYKADNDDTSTYVDQELGIAQGVGTDGVAISGGVLTYGLDSTQTGMTGGNFIFLSATAGATSTATTSQILGKAISATTMFFDQNLIDSNSYITRTFTAPVIFNATTTGTLASSTIRVFTASSTWTKPAFLKHIVIELVGGGGGGAGANSASGNGGGGGGGGGYCREHLTAEELTGTSTIFVNVGIGGYASAGAVSGLSGSTTSFSTFASSTGGGGGQSLGAGGTGGIGLGCDLNIQGGGGSSRFYDSADDGYGGTGGSSALGGGGRGTKNSDGGAGGTYGGGGAGAADTTSASFSGGIGGRGVAIITEYF